MKTVYLVLIALFVNFSVYAQNISREQWDKIVNYVTIEVAKKAMQETDNTQISEEEKMIKAAIAQLPNSLEGNIPYDKFQELLKDGWMTTNNKLVEPLQKRKELYDSNKDDATKLLDSLFSIVGISSKFWSDDNNKQLRSNIEHWLRKQQPSQVPNPPKRDPQATQDNGDHETSLQDISWHTVTISVICSVIIILIVLLVFVYIFHKKIMNNIVASVRREEQAANDSKTSNTNSKTKEIDIEQEIKKGIDPYIRKIEDRLSALEKHSSSSTQAIVSPVEQQKTIAAPPTSVKKLYLGKMSNEIFRCTYDNKRDNTFFYMHEDTKEFFFDDTNLHNALVRGNVVFESTAEYSWNIADAKEVETIAPGKVEAVNGGWKVVQKTKLKFK